MSLPTDRASFKKWCLYKLGAPVIEINVDEDQVDDRVDEALQRWWDYHFDGSDKIFYKYQLDGFKRPGCITEVDILKAGSGYEVGDEIVVADTQNIGSGAEVEVSTVDGNGAITGITITSPGQSYLNDPTYTITTDDGVGAVLNVFNGGYVPLPENVIGAINIFDIGDAMQTNNLFNIRYQIVLNDLYTLTSVSMIPYFMAMQHLQFLEYLLVGRQPIRYNRHRNKMYLDLNWDRFAGGGMIIAECYQVVNPDVYTAAWKDRWLLQYCTQLIKQQWGSNTKKFTGLQGPGGVMITGQQLFQEASQAIAKLEDEMINSYSLPVTDMIG